MHGNNVCFPINHFSNLVKKTKVKRVCFRISVRRDGTKERAGLQKKTERGTGRVEASPPTKSLIDFSSHAPQFDTFRPTESLELANIRTIENLWQQSSQLQELLKEGRSFKAISSFDSTQRTLLLPKKCSVGKR